MIGQVAIEEAVRWAVPAVLTGLAGWWLVKRKAIRAWRQQRRERKARFDAMLSGFAALQHQVAGISKEVRPNGGGSLADAVRRTEASMVEQGDVLQEVRGVLRTQSDLSDDGQFQCTPTGSNTFVNLTYARLLGVGKADLIGAQWKNFIAKEDAPRFLAANAAALAEHRPFSDRCTMVRSDGDRVLVDVTMYPDPERPPAQRWFGRIREVKAA